MRYILFLALIALLLLACSPVIDLPTVTPSVTVINVTITVTPTVTTVTEVCRVETGYEAGTLWLREGAGMEFSALKALREGATLSPTGRVSGVWKQITDSLGDLGWVNSNFISCLGE